METATTYDVRQVTWPERTFIVQRAVKAFDQLPDFFGKSYDAIYDYAQRHGIRASDPPCAIYYAIDEKKGETDLAAAVPVQGNVSGVKDFETVIVPKSKVLTTTHHGSYENMGPAYSALEKYLAEHGLEKGLTIEEYLSDPELEKNPDNWETNIYFVLK